MKFKVILGGTLLVLLGASVVWAGDPWKEKSYTEWTQKDIERLLTKSPWSRKITYGSLQVTSGHDVTDANSGVRQARGRGIAVPDASGKSVPPGSTDYDQPRPLGGMEVGGTKVVRVARPSKIHIRWTSSRTVREGLARRQQLLDIVGRDWVEKFLSTPSQRHVVAVESNLAWGLLSREYLLENTYLELGRSKQRIFPLGVSVLSGRVQFQFPREVGGKPTIEPSEKKVKFVHYFGDLEIKTTFDLGKMVRDGKPDL